ncbi:MAG TPA: hypothetical protein VFQ53_39190 [Kofleriaceae bacterium]|nr:hypothetical protein [Kofleriaceae bacterium]
MRAVIVTLLAAGCGGSAGSGGDAFPPGDGADPIIDALPACPPGQWCVEDSPIAGTLLHDVWAVDPGTVFVVGDAGTILVRRANAWQALASETTANLRGVWAASASDAWAVGEAGTVLRFDGQTWRAVDPGVAIDLHAVWGAGADDVWIAGPSTVLHYDGAGFTPTSLPGTLYAVSGTGGSDVWVTGENARVDHFTGSWTTLDPGVGTTYLGLGAFGPTDVWVTTFTPGKETLRFDGAAWTPVPATGAIFQDVHRTTRSLWAAGGSKVGRFDGATWTLETPGTASDQLWAVHGSGPFLWVVGSNARILLRDDT